jgi:cytochrome c oxidase subunit 1
VGYVLPLAYLLFSLKNPPDAGPNPWRATGLEWQTSSPPPVHNFDATPVVTSDPYNYIPERAEEIYASHEPTALARS